jgi:hypothetical protein
MMASNLKAPTSAGGMAWPGGMTPRHCASETRKNGTPERSAMKICSTQPGQKKTMV